MVDMYHRAMPVDLKEKVLQSFITVGGNLRMIFATSAFGLGIDCPDIRRVIHWGPPNDLDTYVQESGRAGRDGQSIASRYELLKENALCLLPAMLLNTCASSRHVTTSCKSKL